jgi:transposase
MYHRSSKLNLTTGQKNSLKSLMKNTTDKKYYRRLLAILQKSSNGRTFEDIAKEHGVSIRSVQRWVSVYLQIGTNGLEIRKTGSTKSRRITEEDREIILSVLFNDPNIFGYVRNTWSLRSLAKCLTTEELGIPINQFQTSPENTKRYGY